MSIKKLNATRAEKTVWAMNRVLEPQHMVMMVSEIDATEIQSLREQFKQQFGISPTYTALVIKAAALVMQKHPEANRAILGFPFFKKLYQFSQIDMSVAVERNLPFLPGSAYAPVIKDILTKPLLKISEEIQFEKTSDEYTNRAYAKFLNILRWVPRPLSNLLLNLPYYFPSMWAQYRGCAAWVNSPTRAGVDLVVTCWPWPITFSFGVVKERPCLINHKMEARPTMPVIISFDRRIMGGGPASRLFADFQTILTRAETTLATESPKEPNANEFQTQPDRPA